MSRRPFLLGVDQGTSGSRAIILDDEGGLRGYAYRSLPRLHPRPDWVEQDPDIVAAGVAQTIAEAMAMAGCHPGEIAAVGLASQRNTDFVWDAGTGRPLAHAITWQDMRTLPLMDEFAAWPGAADARYRLGYPVAPYMASLHLAWRLRHDAAVRAAAQDGRLRVGQSAAWLIQALGRPNGHRLDRSLAQATGLYDLRADRYWAPWLEWVGVPASALPAASPTLADYGHLTVRDASGREAAVPVRAMIGDQQAALFGHDCRHIGDADCTHGTASYVKIFVGHEAPALDQMDTLYAWDLGEGQTHCLEAQTTVTGAVIRWLREQMHLFDSYPEMDRLAASVPDAGGVLFVPAFTGLNVPVNDRRARGVILGLSLGTTTAHLSRAMLEAIAHQLRAILETVAAETGLRPAQLLVGGGVAASDIACQIQADLLGLPVLRPAFTETTARAAALLAGLGAGTWTAAALPPLPGGHVAFSPALPAARRDADYARWQEGVALAQRWGEHEVPATVPEN